MGCDTEECSLLNMKQPTTKWCHALVAVHAFLVVCLLQPPVVAAAEYATRDCGACAGTGQQSGWTTDSLF